MSDSGKRVFVIGLDGATLDIIRPMVDEGRLPTFKRIMDEGAFGNLRSTVLPVTPPAWSSFMTGKNPGKHGVYGFFSNKPDSYETEFTTSLSIKAKKIWDYFGEDKRVGLVDVPLTFPPQKVNGCMISGMPVPSEESIFTYPPELHTELIGAIGDYMIDNKLRMMTRGGTIEALKHLYRYTEMRMDAIRYLLDKKGTFDFFMAVFRGTDFAQHAIFKYLDPEFAVKYAEETKKYGQIIQQFYEKMDGYVAEIIELMGEDCTLILMSDHGVGPLKRFFYINRWLRREGFLRLRSGCLGSGVKWRRKRVGDVFERLGCSFVSGFLPGVVRDMWLRYPVRCEKPAYSMVDWANTRAYANLTWTDGVIKINLRGKEAEGCVEPEDYDAVCDELVEELSGLVDDESGEKVMDAVYRRGEIYSGPFLDDAPDVVALTRGFSYAFRVSLTGEELFETPDDPVPATHRMNGIFFIKGPDIKGGVELADKDITDVAPTILHLLGYEVPEDMDGKVMVDVMDEKFVKENPVVFCKGEDLGDGDKGEAGFSENEREEIERSLRDLGYLS